MEFWEKQNALLLLPIVRRFRLKISFEMEISGIIMETFTLGTAIGLNITHNASFYAESINAAAWNRARLVGAKLSRFCWCILKSTRLESFQRDHGKRVRFTSEASIWKYWSVLFD